MQKSPMCCAKTSLQAPESASEISQLFNISVHDTSVLNIAYLHAQVPNDFKSTDFCQDPTEINQNNTPCNTAHVIEDYQNTSCTNTYENFEHQDEYCCTTEQFTSHNDNLEMPNQLYLYVDYSSSLPIVG